MLFEYYKSKSAKVPKQQEQQEKALAEINKFAQISPTSAETNEPSTIAAIATNCASVTASKNLQADEMMPLQSEAANNASFHPRLKYSLKQTNDTADEGKHDNSVVMTSIPTSVLVPNAGDATSQDQQQLLQLDIKPTINQIPGLAMTPITAPANVKPQAAAIAEALLRNGYHSFQQQLRAQEILRQRSPRPLSAGANSASGGSIGSVFGGNGDLIPSKILENLLRKQQAQEQRHSECENEPETGSEDEDDSRMNSFDDIHLIENAVPKFGNNSLPRFPANNGGSVPTQDAQALAFRNLEYTLSDYGGSSNGSSTSPNGLGPDGEPTYECRHCGKRYRWKSTLRRHENVECGGKEPAHQCPYCPYKSKQRGNLGVHVRKHHTDLPQLPSKRRSKYSLRMEEMSMNSSGASNDDSKSKLVVNNTNWQSTSGNLSN